MASNSTMRLNSVFSKRSLRQAECALGILLVCTAPAFARKKQAALTKAQLTPEMIRLIDQSAGHERLVLKAM